MDTRRVSSFLLFAAICLVSSASYAESSVVILKFETFKVDKPIVEAFDAAMESGINNHEDMKVKASGQLTVQDLALTAGCDSPNAECLSQLGGMVGADQLIFGSLQQSDDVLMFNMRLFDFSERRFTREVTDVTVRGTQSEIIDAIPAIIENFVYGSVGVLEILVDSGSPEVYLNGEKVGRAPTLIENLPLGEHVVLLKDASGDEQTQTVILRRGQPTKLEFAFGTVADTPVASSGPSTVPGWILVGVGAVGVGFGIYQTMEVGRVDDDFAALCAQPGNVCEGSNAALGSPEDAGRARTLEDEGSSAKTMQLIGFSVGGAALVTGGYLLYRAYTHTTDEQTDGVTVHVTPHRNGISAGMGFSF